MSAERHIKTCNVNVLDEPCVTLLPKTCLATAPLIRMGWWSKCETPGND